MLAKIKNVPPRTRLAALAPLAALALFAAAPASSAAAEKTLYVFPSSGSNGRYPQGALLRDNAGALYGTTQYGGAGGYGTLFRLTPPLPGKAAWSISVLYNFSVGFGGEVPNANLVRDANGALYGTAAESGGYEMGVVFRLSPPMPGQTRWTETVLHAFDYNIATNAGDGSQPDAGVIMDANGVLYGTTYYGGTTADPLAIGFGTVFELAPPKPGQTKWEETVLYRFKGSSDGRNPSATLIRDSSGALYGTTFLGGSGRCADEFGNVIGCGTVFKLTPPAPGHTNWAKLTIHQFAGGADGALPLGKLLLDGHGAVYGTTTQGGKGQCGNGIGNIVGCGTVFKLTPPRPGRTDWTQIVIHNFKGIPDGIDPQGGLIADTAGNLYGGTLGGGSGGASGACVDLFYRNVGCGTIFKLRPPALGQTAWTETVLYNFRDLVDGWKPLGDLVADPRGNLFAVTRFGNSSLNNLGTVFEITP
jgi:uncharacterized repeat protein (TIGR03803 family)